MLFIARMTVFPSGICHATIRTPASRTNVFAYSRCRAKSAGETRFCVPLLGVEAGVAVGEVLEGDVELRVQCTVERRRLPA